MPRQYNLNLSIDFPAQRNKKTYRTLSIAITKSYMPTKKLNPTLEVHIEN